MFHSFRSQLFRPVDIASLVFFRIAFGLLLCIDLAESWITYGLLQGAYDPERFRFKYFGWEWAEPLPEPWLSLVFWIGMLSALGIAAGFAYRWTAPLAALVFAYVFLLEKSHYLNHGYLICWIAGLMTFLPANRAFSVDVARSPDLRRRQIPFWCLFLLPFLMGVVYVYGGLAKLNPDWLRGVPLLYWLQRRADLPVIGPLLAQDWVAYFMSYGGLLLDLFVVFFLLRARTRNWALGFVLFFHLSNTLIFNIGVFPWLSIALTLLFWPPDTPRRWVEGLARHSAFVGRLKERWQRHISSSMTGSRPLWQASMRLRPAIAGAVAMLCAFHLLYPLRHHLIPGPVAWTEEGHRFAWRMMLRSKNGGGEFTVIDTKTGETFAVDPEDHLLKRQARKLYTHPDMILQFAHFLRDEWIRKGHPEVEVYARIRARLNDHPYQFHVDPEIDLASREWSPWRKSDWITEMAEESRK